MEGREFWQETESSDVLQGVPRSIVSVIEQYLPGAAIQVQFGPDSVSIQFNSTGTIAVPSAADRSDATSVVHGEMTFSERPEEDAAAISITDLCIEYPSLSARYYYLDTVVD